jgi:hypothetical protein
MRRVEIVAAASAQGQLLPGRAGVEAISAGQHQHWRREMFGRLFSSFRWEISVGERSRGDIGYFSATGIFSG